jgi:hypothetical protein
MSKHLFYGGLLLPVLLMSAVQSFGQKAKDIIENGIPIREERKLFLKFTNDVLLYDIGEEPDDFIPVEDSTCLLPHRTAVNVYLKPLNPLKYSFDTTLVFVPDAIADEANTAIDGVIGVLKIPSPSACSAEEILFEDIADRLKKGKQDSIGIVFNLLRDMPFDDKKITQADLARYELLIDGLKKFFTALDADLTKADGKIDGIDYQQCDTNTSAFVYKYVYHQVAKQLRDAYTEAYKGFANLMKADALVAGVVKRAAVDYDGGFTWFLPLGPVRLKDGKVSVFTISINNDGFIFDTQKKDIVAVPKKNITSKTFRIRRFQRFVTEVSAGVVYTFLTFPNYGTTTDSTGKQYVARGADQVFKKVNISGMVNFVYFIQHSAIHPLLQIGVGGNTDYPTLFLGTGFRLNTGMRRVAFGVGFAGTWIKTLNKLKVGDCVSGTAEIDKDITHEFSFPVKPYLGIQYNF